MKLALRQAAGFVGLLFQEISTNTQTITQIASTPGNPLSHLCLPRSGRLIERNIVD
jgi:hypothetical protein